VSHGVSGTTMEDDVKVIATIVLLAAILDSRIANAVPGEMCRSASECSHGEVCVADSVTSSTGHCSAIRVLP
jgi:hypothetical protein